MFTKNPAFLGQVPLVWGPSSWGAGIVSPPRPPAPPPQATGGWIEKAVGTLWFFPDPDVLDRIEAATGERPSESIEAQVKFCNPTPQTMPVLGDFIDPDTGLVCFLHLPDGWFDAWMGWDVPEDLEAVGLEGPGRTTLGQVRLVQSPGSHLGQQDFESIARGYCRQDGSGGPAMGRVVPAIVRGSSGLDRRDEDAESRTGNSGGDRKNDAGAEHGAPAAAVPVIPDGAHDATGMPAWSAAHVG
jgi:hypothetical protein